MAAYQQWQYPDQAATADEKTNLPLYNDQAESPKPKCCNRMRSARRAVVGLLVLSTVAFGLTTTSCMSAHHRTAVSEASNTASADSLNKFLHAYFPNTFKEGGDDSAQAPGLAKRQNSSATSSDSGLQISATTILDQTVVTQTTTQDAATSSVVNQVSTTDTPSSTTAQDTSTQATATATATTSQATTTQAATTSTSQGTTTSSAKQTTTESTTQQTTTVKSTTATTSTGTTLSTTAPPITSSHTSTSTLTSTRPDGGVVTMTSTFVVAASAEASASASSTSSGGTLQPNAASPMHGGSLFEVALGLVLGGVFLI